MGSTGYWIRRQWELYALLASDFGHRNTAKEVPKGFGQQLTDARNRTCTYYPSWKLKENPMSHNALFVWRFLLLGSRCCHAESGRGGPAVG